MRKIAHETMGVQKQALIGEVFREYNPGDRVLTIDGVMGSITAVLDGPFNQTESYQVELDNGIGGGLYSVSQLSRAEPRKASSEGDFGTEGDETTEDGIESEASVLHLATEDYPELGSILSERLPNENLRVFASKTALSTDTPGSSRASDDQKLDKLQQAEQVASPAIEDIGQPDACSWCGHDKFDEFTNTGRGTRARCSQCNGTMTSGGGQWQPDFANSPENAAARTPDFRSTINDLSAVHGSRYDLLGTDAERAQAIAANPRADGRAFINVFADSHLPASEASYDPDLGFHLTATWADVRRKAKAIRDSGGVRILAANANAVVGEVQGEHHLYESSYSYVPTTRKVADWSCGCKWGAYAWGRSPAYARFEGRQCSHVTALQYEAQSRGMFGRTVTEDSQRLPGQYQRSPVTVQYDRGADHNLNRRSVPPGNMRRTFSSLGELQAEARHNGSGLYTFHSGDTHPVEEVSPGEASHGSVEGYDRTGHRIGEIGYGLHSHGDGGGSISVDGPHLEPGHEHHGSGMVEALEHHLQSERGVPRLGDWTYEHDLEHGHHFQASLDLAPVHAFTLQMVAAKDDPDSILAMLIAHRVPDGQALQILRWAATVTGDEDGDQSNGMVPGMATRDTTELKKQPHHHDHHTNDTRRHAPDFAQGIGWNAPGLIWCDQCNGSGCGHCGGTGQVMAGVSPTGGPGVGDLSTTTSPVADDNPAAGEDTTGGISSTGVQLHQALLQHYTADYTADSFLTGPPAQNYESPTNHSNSANPASTGWATSADPQGWVHPLISNTFGVTYDASLHTAATHPEGEFDGPTVSGVALKAHDTGRVLMIQRSMKDDSDPAKGRWEFPGGHHEEGDKSSLHAGVREWEEEVGQPFPEGGHVAHTWRSGPYMGHVVVIPSEDGVKFGEGRSTVNPDDPGGDDHEQSAWWHPEHAKKNPALRQELKDDNPFSDIKKAAALKGPIWHVKEYDQGGRSFANTGDGVHDDIFDNREEAHAYRDRMMDRAKEIGTWHPDRFRVHEPASMIIEHQPRSYELPGRTIEAQQNAPRYLTIEQARAAAQEAVAESPYDTFEQYHAASMAEQEVHMQRLIQASQSNEDSLEDLLAQHKEIRSSYAPGDRGAYDQRKKLVDLEFRIRKLRAQSSLHDEPEAALPSTDGGEDDALQQQDSGWQPGEPAPGQYLSAHPDIPWGYPGGPSGISDLATADDDTSTQMTASLDEVPLENLVAAFQATAGGRSIASEAKAPDANSGPSDGDIAAMMKKVLAGEVTVGEHGISKSAMKEFSFAEQQALITEGATTGQRARNFDDLQIEGTHYAMLGEDQPPDELLWL